ncbi:unnamed protein product [Sphenostylis stenocarpa]|uniref:Uncharacterized protein n=1 Tax=Sphenostylis stenocarpa TaxID=92480 RepID=A0AA86S6F6_9FABA|nr:unnamed protein product [Sphenostylis stenocarpa]
MAYNKGDLNRRERDITAGSANGIPENQPTPHRHSFIVRDSRWRCHRHRIALVVMSLERQPKVGIWRERRDGDKLGKR